MSTPEDDAVVDNDIAVAAPTNTTTAATKSTPEDDAVVDKEIAIAAPTTTTTTAATKKNKKKKKKKKPPMKVTLLSGFLGAGKTTLLKHILRTNNNNLKEGEKLRMAVIVNDMGELNLDAEEIKTSRVIQEDAEMVEMHNGCICCTLRGDLLKTVKQLSEDEANFDYLVIESTGISEPLPVAQTFVMNVDEMTMDGDHDHQQLRQQQQQQQQQKLQKQQQQQQQAHPQQQQQETNSKKANDNTKEKQKKKKKLTVAKDKKRSLFHYAKLDTLVTVVDALTIYDVLSSIETLADRDNITGMTGKHTTGDNEDDRFPDEAKQQYSAVLVAIRAMEVDQLRMSLKGNGLDTAGDREDLVERLTTNFKKRMEEEYTDNRTIIKLWLDQIEFANVIVISKVSVFLKENNNDNNGAAMQKLVEIQNLLRKLNPDANIIVPHGDNYSDLDVYETMLNTNLFNMRKAEKSLSWIRELEAEEEHNPETEEYGISSLVFEAADMPFHPGRLHQILKDMKEVGNNDGGGGHNGLLSLGATDSNNNSGKNHNNPNSSNNKSARPFEGVVRMKGQIWLANCNVFPLSLHTAGRHVEMQPGSTLAPFLVEKPRGHWTEKDQRVYQWLLDRDWWSEKWGDRRSQLVIIGLRLEPDLIRKAFNDALLTEEEDRILGGSDGWHRLMDPFFNGRLQGMCKSFHASLSRGRDPRAT